MNKKRIFIIAPSFYGIDRSICRAFESSGFQTFLKNSPTKPCLLEVILFKLIKEIPSARGILNPWLKLVLINENRKYISLIKKFRPDVIFIIKGETVFPETLMVIKETLKIPCVAYVWDCPFYSYAGKFADDFRKNNFAQCMHLYDHIFVYDPYYAEEIRKRGVVNVDYLPLATDPQRYKRINLSPDENAEYDFDVAFVGFPFSNRVEIINELQEFKLGVFGEGWNKLKRNGKTPLYYRGKAANDKVLKIYSSAKIVLNIHDPEATRGLNTRTFDIPACGAFELVDYKPELENLFKAREEIIYYKDIADLRRLIRYYLNNPQERKEIANNGKNSVLNSHTWRHRVKEIATTLEKRGIIQLDE